VPSYRITAPDGAVYNVTPPEGTNPSESEILARVQSQGTAGDITKMVDDSKTRVAAMTPAPAPQGNAITRGYQDYFAKPVTRAVSGVADTLTAPLVNAARVAQGEPLTSIAAHGAPRTPGDRDNPLARAVVPQTPIEAGMMVGTGVAGKAIPALYKAAPALARILMGAGGGEIGNQLEQGTTGKGALIGGGGAAAGEVLGKYLIEPARRMLPGAKKAISLEDTRRVGGDIATVTGAPPMRTPGDFLDAATGAVTRKTEGAASYEASLVTYRQAVADARAEAARLTREGRMAQAAEWHGKQQQYQQTVDRLTAEAQRATAGFQNTIDRMGVVVNEQRRGNAAQGIHDVINRVAPQLAAALQEPGAQGLRTAGAGGARRVLSDAKEAVTVRLEQAAPDGILVPALSDTPVNVRDALWALSEIGAGRGAQFAKNPLDRDITGAIPRMQYGDVAGQIRQGLDTAAPGMGEVFQRGQQVYREGLAVSKTLLEPNKNWTPTGDVNVPALATDIIKPRMRRALEGKVGPDRYQDIATTVTNLPREMPRARVQHVDPVLPDAPVKPMPRDAIAPNMPAEPTPAQPSAADTVMTTLFGPQNRIQQGRDTLVNWPAVQKAIQTPAGRAELEAAVGADGYAAILKSVLRGATEGADVPARGDGRFLGPLMEWASGRNPGGGAFASAWHRSAVPNFGAQYVGNKPMQLPPALQAILDAGLQKAGGAALRKDTP
jgi:hypothetical protein